MQGDVRTATVRIRWRMIRSEKMQLEDHAVPKGNEKSSEEEEPSLSAPDGDTPGRGKSTGGAHGASAR